MQEWLVGFERIMAALESLPDGKRYAYPIRRGTVRAGVHAPRPPLDPQGPHEQDDLYTVIAGSGTFAKGEERRPFKPGDAILVEAGVPHRFEGCGEGFATRAVFRGPPGGEASP